MYSRAKALEAHDLHLPEVDRQFVLSVCTNSTACLEEQQAWDVYFCKRELSRFTYDNAEFVRGLELRRARAEELGHSWEVYPTTYLKTYQKLWRQTSPQLAELENRFNALAELQWNKEQERFSAMPSGTLSSAEERQGLAVGRFGQVFGRFGFERDPKLSRKGLAVLYKEAPFCKLVIALNLDSLRQDVFGGGEGAYGRVGRPVGPRVEIVLAALHPSARKIRAESPQCAVLRFEWLLPIRKTPLWTDYSTFYSDGALEALIHVHGLFYEIIRDSLESALS